MLRDFSYDFQRCDRIGIVGRNGVGKSTFLDLLTGAVAPDSGLIDRGETLRIGYYRQEGMEFRPGDTVLDIIPDTRLLARFLFPHDMLSTRVERLSGGEKRRLYLLTILMQEPNLLILDEPTNDLDIVTLNILEEYLKEFQGSLLIVSHDRHFLDRVTDHLLVFCGEGHVKDFIGSFSEYRAYVRDVEKNRATSKRPDGKKAEPVLPDGEGSAAAGFVAPNPVPASAGSEDGSRDAGHTALAGKAMLDAAIKWGPKLLKREIDEIPAEAGLSEYLRDEIMQAARRRFYKPEYIACPGCGRTMYNLQETFEEVQRRTAHLRGLVIAVMGCIVNGPGEMADADWGYVGEGGGRVTIYHRGEPVLRHIPDTEAIDELLRLIETDASYST